MPRYAETPSEHDPHRRRKLAARLGAPHLFPLVFTLAAAALAYLLLRPGGFWAEALFRAVSSPETQVKQALAGQRQARLGDVYGFASGGVAVLDPLVYGDVSVAMDGRRAEVIAIVDASGEVDFPSGHATLGYVGRETFSMKPCSVAGFCADGAQFGRLRAALATLFRRLDAVRDGDAASLVRLVSERYPGGKPALERRLLLDPRPQSVSAKAFQIRVERDTAEVGEDDVVMRPGETPEAVRVRLRLIWEDGRFRIVAGL